MRSRHTFRRRDLRGRVSAFAINALPYEMPTTPPLLHLGHRAFGAQILDVGAPFAAPLFYVSPTSVVADAPVRGGVPVLFPQFADTGSLQKHGFVRNRHWTLTESITTAAAARAHYRLAIDEDEVAGWPYRADLELSAHLTPTSLDIALQIRNSGTRAFTWTGGLHPYFAVAELTACSLSGLSGSAVRDRYAPTRTREAAVQVTWDGTPCERLYDTAATLTLQTPTSTWKLTATGFDQWMVWNPGREGAKELADLPDADWQKLICIEPVCVSRPVAVAAGECFVGTLTISANA